VSNDYCQQHTIVFEIGRMEKKSRTMHFKGNTKGVNGSHKCQADQGWTDVFFLLDSASNKVNVEYVFCTSAWCLYA
jgi:hypothetical protein